MAKKEKNKKHFFKDFKAELKKVIWPTPKQVVNNTVAVAVIVLITAAIVFVLDLVFDVLNTQGVNRLKSNIKNKTVVETVINNNTTEAINGTAEGTITEETQSTTEKTSNNVEQ